MYSSKGQLLVVQANHKVMKAINETYKSFNTNQVPLAILDFQIPREGVDINVSPDKRTIFVHSEGNLISAIRVSRACSSGANSSPDWKRSSSRLALHSLSEVLLQQPRLRTLQSNLRMKRTPRMTIHLHPILAVLLLDRQQASRYCTMMSQRERTSSPFHHRKGQIPLLGHDVRGMCLLRLSLGLFNRPSTRPLPLGVRRNGLARVQGHAAERLDAMRSATFASSWRGMPVKH